MATASFQIKHKMGIKRFPALELPRSGSTGLISGFSATPSRMSFIKINIKVFRRPCQEDDMGLRFLSKTFKALEVVKS